MDTAKGIFHNQTYTHQQILYIISGLGLTDIFFDNASDLSDDLKNPETVIYLTNGMELYLKRIEGLPGEATLCERGLELRQRLEQIGFHSATTLLAIGKK